MVSTKPDQSIKKGFKKGVIIALFVIFVLSLYTIYVYNQVSTLQSQLNTLEWTHLNYVSNHIYNNTKYWEQVNTLQFYVGNHSHSNAEYNTLIGRLNFLNTTYQDYVLSHNYTNDQYYSIIEQYNSLYGQYNSLNTKYQNYVSTHIHTNSEYNSLQSQVNNLTAPKLIGVDLGGVDTRPLSGRPYLHVSGYVCNVGTNTANNSKIHAILYQSGEVVAEDTYITLGIINGESWIDVDSNIYYNGLPLTGYNITLEWTS